MDRDPQLSGWTEDWQAGAEGDSPAEGLREYAHGRRRFMSTWFAGEIAVGVIALPLLAYLAWTTTDAVERLAMLMLAAITIAAMGVGWWNWRGSMLASAKTTAEFVSISTARLRRMRQAWRIGWVVLAAEVAVFSVWIWNQLYAGTGEHTLFAERFSWGWLAFMSLSAVGFLLWIDRVIRRDEQKFAELQRELL